MRQLLIIAIFSTLPLLAKPNVVLIMADDMGYECISANGGRSYSTPVFERIALEGMRFTNCYSQPVCTPSRIKIMTGKYNWRNYERFAHMPKGQTTFAHLMRDGGYATALTGKWQLWGGPETESFQSGTTPEEAGFDEYMHWAYPFELSAAEMERYSAVGLPRAKTTSRFWHPAVIKNGQYLHTSMDDYGPDLFSDFALDFIERHKDEPFFLYYPNGADAFSVCCHASQLNDQRENQVQERSRILRRHGRIRGSLGRAPDRSLGQAGLGREHAGAIHGRQRHPPQPEIHAGRQGSERRQGTTRRTPAPTCRCSPIGPGTCPRV